MLCKYSPLPQPELRVLLSERVQSSITTLCLFRNLMHSLLRFHTQVKFNATLGEEPHEMHTVPLIYVCKTLAGAAQYN